MDDGTKAIPRSRWPVRVLLPCIASLGLFVAALFLFILPQVEKSVIERRKEAIRALTESASSILTRYHQQEQEGLLTRDEAQRLASQQISHMRYGVDMKNYFWIADSDARPIMHPYRPDLIDMDLTKPENAQIKHLLNRFAAISTGPGEGFISYEWQRNNDPNRVTTKYSYAKTFRPWGWIVGTGLHLEDVRAELAALKQDLIVLSSVIFGISLLLMFSVILHGVRSERNYLRAKVGLEESHRQYGTLFDKMLNGFAVHEIITDEDGNAVDYRFVTVNPAFERMMGFKADDVIGKTIHELVPDMEHCWLETYAQVVETGQPARIEGFSRALNKHLEVEAFRPSPGQFACIIQDVTDRTMARQALIDGEAQLRTVINASKDAMVSIGPEGRIEVFNRAAEEMFGYSAEEVRGEPVERLMPVQERSAHRERVRGFFTHGSPNGAIGKSVELTATHRDGNSFPIELSLTTGMSKERPFVLAVVRDIREHKAAEQDLQRAKEAAEEASRAKSDFLANMSHEIRTPMTAILGFADVLLDNDEPGTPSSVRLEAAETIKRNGEYLLGIINDILDLSKIEAGKVNIERIACSPRTVLSEVESLIKVPADAKGLSFDLEYGSAMPETICTDPTRLRQILINIVGNAIKFTEIGGIRLIARMIDDKGPRLQIDVIDTGIGMSSKQVNRLFQPFVQADTSTTRRFGGTGLGLTISKRFAQMLGGDVGVVESKPGVGTCFRVTIDASPDEGIDPAQPSESIAVLFGTPTESATDTTTLSLARRRILLAEDGPDNQRLIGHLLGKAGAEVTAVANGELAVHAALAAQHEGRPYDAVLMDMQMPVMDGYEATKRLRDEGYNGAIIALTANAMTGDREKCLAVGCNDYAAKPIDRTALFGVIHRCIQEPALATT